MIAHLIGYPIGFGRVDPNRPRIGSLVGSGIGVRIAPIVSARVGPGVVKQVCGLFLVKIKFIIKAVTRDAAQSDDDSSLRNPKNGTSACGVT